jgi:hypothetical protein
LWADLRFLLMRACLRDSPARCRLCWLVLIMAVRAFAEPGFIEFDEDDLGELGFIAVTGELDCRDADREGRPGVEFSWQGSDEGDDVSGRGWAALNPEGTLEGHIYFHLGDDSAFRAERT